MNKEEIIEKLNSIDLDKNQYMVISGAAMVLLGIKETTDDIDLSCSEEYFNSINNWDVKTSESGINKKLVKTDGIVDIGTNFYYQEYEEKIDGFRVLNAEGNLYLKKLMNRKKDVKDIKLLDLYLCLKDNYRYERNLREKGITLIGGVDEVGRGPLVGPVVAACVILPENFNLEGLTDSKKLSETKREFFFEEIKKQAISYGIGIVDEKRIDEINIYEATKEAMIQAIHNCSVLPEHVLTDAMKLDIEIPVTPIIKGDLKSITISAASVIAKVTRDHLLYELDKKYPMYDFKHNVGYPTKKHLEAIGKYGVIPEHRRSYGPVSDYLKKNNL